MAFVVGPHGYLSMDDSAIAELGWTNGQRISAEQVGQGIAANARAFCRDASVRCPELDIKSLAEKCGHKPLN